MKDSKNNRNVGVVFYSPYFDSRIVVTSYTDDDNWTFKLLGEDDEKIANSKFSYFMKEKLFVGRINNVTLTDDELSIIQTALTIVIKGMEQYAVNKGFDDETANIYDDMGKLYNKLNKKYF